MYYAELPFFFFFWVFNLFHFIHAVLVILFTLAISSSIAEPLQFVFPGFCYIIRRNMNRSHSKPFCAQNVSHHGTIGLLACHELRAKACFDRCQRRALQANWISWPALPLGHYCLPSQRCYFRIENGKCHWWEAGTNVFYASVNINKIT